MELRRANWSEEYVSSMTLEHFLKTEMPRAYQDEDEDTRRELLTEVHSKCVGLKSSTVNPAGGQGSTEDSKDHKHKLRK